MPDMALLARRGLTPLLVLLLVAPPRVCTCAHGHALASQASHDEDGDDESMPCHPHPAGPVNDPDCPCVQPALVKATIVVSYAATPPPAETRSDIAREPVRVGDHAVALDPRSADPPLYLTGCALRF